MSATLVESLTLQVLEQAQNVVITADDVRKGHVSVPQGIRFRYRARQAAVEMANRSTWVKMVEVRGPSGRTTFHTTERIVLPAGQGRMHTVRVDYTFVLAAGVVPGVCDWPVSMTVLP